MRILRQIIAVIAGMVAGGTAVMAIESISVLMHPMPEGIAIDDPGAMKEWIASLPPSAFLIVAIAWMAGALVGAFVARMAAARRSAIPAGIVLLLFLVAVVYNLTTIPSPWWMWLLGILGSMVGGLVGLVLAAPRQYTIRAERHIHAPVDCVFTTLARIEHFSKAVPGITDVEFLTDQQYGVGTRFRETRIMNGREAKAVLEVVELDENRMIRLVSDEGGAVWDTVFQVEPAGDDGTRMIMHMDAGPRTFIARLMTPMIINMVGQFVQADMDSVTQYCESQSR